MRRHAKAFVIITFTLAVAFSTPGTRAEAGHGCRYSIFVSRENIPGDQGARLCDVAEVVDWLRAVPGAEVSAQAPPGVLNDGFTVTVFLTRGFLYEPEPLARPPAARGAPDGKGVSGCGIWSGRLRAIEEHLPRDRAIPEMGRGGGVAISRCQPTRAEGTHEARDVAAENGSHDAHPDGSAARLQPPRPRPCDARFPTRDPGFHRSSRPAELGSG